MRGFAPFELPRVAATPPLATPSLAATCVGVCLLALSCPGGTSFAAAFPPFLCCAHMRTIGPKATPLWPALAAGTAAAGLTGVELALHVDTSTQSSAFISLAAAAAIATIAAPNTPPEPAAKALPLDDAADELQQARREALRLRRSWDSRLSWRVRKAKAAMAAEADGKAPGP